MGYGLGVSLWGSDGCGERDATPPLKASKHGQKGKKSEQKRGKGEGAMRKKVTFSMGRARKSGGITPTLRVSDIPTGSASYRYK
jgi:hypothetical protein